MLPSYIYLSYRAYDYSGLDFRSIEARCDYKLSSCGKLAYAPQDGANTQKAYFKENNFQIFLLYLSF